MQLLGVKVTVSDEAESAAKVSTHHPAHIYLPLQKGSFSHKESRFVTTSTAGDGHTVVKVIFPDRDSAFRQEFC